MHDFVQEELSLIFELWAVQKEVSFTDFESQGWYLPTKICLRKRKFDGILQISWSVKSFHSIIIDGKSVLTYFIYIYSIFRKGPRQNLLEFIWQSGVNLLRYAGYIFLKFFQDFGESVLI